MALPIELQQNEQVVKEYHRHPIFLYGQLALIAAAGILPILLVNWIFGGRTGFIADIVPALSILWAIGALVAGFISWYSYLARSMDSDQPVDCGYQQAQLVQYDCFNG